jgi:hypothetical protein
MLRSTGDRAAGLWPRWRVTVFTAATVLRRSTMDQTAGWRALCRFHFDDLGGAVVAVDAGLRGGLAGFCGASVPLDEDRGAVPVDRGSSGRSSPESSPVRVRPGSGVHPADGLHHEDLVQDQGRVGACPCRAAARGPGSGPGPGGRLSVPGCSTRIQVGTRAGWAPVRAGLQHEDPGRDQGRVGACPCRAAPRGPRSGPALGGCPVPPARPGGRVAGSWPAAYLCGWVGCSPRSCGSVVGPGAGRLGSGACLTSSL